MVFEYDPEEWSLDSNRERLGCSTVFGNLSGVFFLMALIALLIKEGFQEGWPILLGVGFLPIWLVGWNFQTFSSLLYRSTLELENEQLILHLSPEKQIKINLSDLHDVYIQQYTMPKYNMIGTVIGIKAHVFFISSPDLPWYFQMVGLFAHKSFKGRGFFITSRHTNYELFLEQIEKYEKI